MSVTSAVWKIAVGGGGESGGQEVQALAMSVVTANFTQFATVKTCRFGGVLSFLSPCPK